MMRRHRYGIRSSSICAIAAIALTLPVAAQQALDRSKIPPPSKPAALHVPAWTKSTLSNGAGLIVCEQHALPLVSFTITFLGGTDQYEPADRRGVAELTSSMMSEGTKTRDGEALSNALQLLGTSVQTRVGSENGSIGFQSTAAKFPQTLDVLVDVLVHSTFPADALERQRGQRLVQLAQAKAQSAQMAQRVFARILYGPSHPFGQTPTDESIKAITRDDLVAFHKTYFQPGRALVTVVGDVNAATIKATLEKALASWPKGGDKPAFTYPALPARQPTTIYLADKPGAPSTTFVIGNPGPARSTPDYYSLLVMNTMLGGLFQSRLNLNLREEKGISYGVTSNFAYGKGPGAFRAGGDVVSAKSDVGLVEFMKELRGMTGARPITDDEFATAKDSLIQKLPGSFGTVQGINGAITQLWIDGVGDDFYQQSVAKIAAVTKDDVMRVAKQYIDLDHLAIVIVGDRATIEAPIRATKIAPVTIVDAEGKVISASSTAAGRSLK